MICEVYRIGDTDFLRAGRHVMPIDAITSIDLDQYDEGDDNATVSVYLSTREKPIYFHNEKGDALRQFLKTTAI